MLESKTKRQTTKVPDDAWCFQDLGRGTMDCIRLVDVDSRQSRIEQNYASLENRFAKPYASVMMRHAIGATAECAPWLTPRVSQ
jgi:hypothetical protein